MTARQIKPSVVRDAVRLYVAVGRELQRQGRAAGLPDEYLSREAVTAIYIQLTRQGYTGLPERLSNGLPSVQLVSASGNGRE